MKRITLNLINPELNGIDWITFKAFSFY